MYVNYYKKTQMIDGENEPIGILLCADKDDAVVEMTLGDNVFKIMKKCFKRAKSIGIQDTWQKLKD